jgi:hypothetical protein
MYFGLYLPNGTHGEINAQFATLGAAAALIWIKAPEGAESKSDLLAPPGGLLCQADFDAGLT